MRKKMIIAVDGYSSTGKSTFARRIASMLGYLYIDTGAMYRAVALACLRRGIIKSSDPFCIDMDGLQDVLGKCDISFSNNSGAEHADTFLNGENVERQIRSVEVSDVVSNVSSVPQVRDFVDERLREFGKGRGIVMDGRDIGTVVFPDADIKIFMTAAPEVRAGRRLKEMREKGNDSVTYDEILENLEKRDRTDVSRAVSPLRKADDAIVLDNSEMTLDDQMEWIKSILK